eukprot:352045_1
MATAYPIRFRRDDGTVSDVSYLKECTMQHVLHAVEDHLTVDQFKRNTNYTIQLYDAQLVIVDDDDLEAAFDGLVGSDTSDEDFMDIANTPPLVLTIVLTPKPVTATIVDDDQKRTVDASNDDIKGDDNKNPIAPFIPHMTLEEANALQINDRFDHRDKFGRVFAARVAQREAGRIRVKYEGWPSKYNVWSDIRSELWKFSRYQSISKRPRHRFIDLNIGDFIDVFSTHLGNGGGKWQYAEIKQLDGESGQVQVMFNNSKEECVYWVHLDDTSEVAVFATKA